MGFFYIQFIFLNQLKMEDAMGNRLIYNDRKQGKCENCKTQNGNCSTAHHESTCQKPSNLNSTVFSSCHNESVSNVVTQKTEKSAKEEETYNGGEYYYYFLFFFLNKLQYDHLITSNI